MDVNKAANVAEPLRWQCLCLCRQISPVAPIIALLRQFPGGLCPENQAWFVKECVDESLTEFFPKSIDYERKLLRAVVVAVESDGHELAEELMTVFSCRLTTTHNEDFQNNLNKNPSTQWSYKLYAYNTSSRFAKLDDNMCDEVFLEGIREREQIILEKGEAEADQVGTDSTSAMTTTVGDDQCGLLALHVSNDMLAGETGCWDWEAGFFLSEFIFNNPRLFSGKHILELGSGCGMAGVALSRVSAASVLCTDGDKEALDNCLQNLYNNGLQATARTSAGAATESTASPLPPPPTVTVQRLRWEDGASSLSKQHSIDVIVGADLTYDPVNIPPLIKILKEILLSSPSSASASDDKNNLRNSNRGMVAYIATTQRSESTYRILLDALDREPQLRVQDISKEATEGVISRHGGGGGGGGVRFCHVASLEAARERIVLHRITRK